MYINIASRHYVYSTHDYCFMCLYHNQSVQCHVANVISVIETSKLVTINVKSDFKSWYRLCMYNNIIIIVDMQCSAIVTTQLLGIW